MKIPTKLKIGGHVISIIESADEKNAGEYDIYKNTISLGKNLPQSQKEATLIHEIFHALNTTLDGGHNFSHALLDSLSEQFYQVLTDNKLLDEGRTTSRGKRRDKKDRNTRRS